MDRPGRSNPIKELLLLPGQPDEPKFILHGPGRPVVLGQLVRADSVCRREELAEQPGSVQQGDQRQDPVIRSRRFARPRFPASPARLPGARRRRRSRRSGLCDLCRRDIGLRLGRRRDR